MLNTEKKHVHQEQPVIFPYPTRWRQQNGAWQFHGVLVPPAVGGRHDGYSAMIIGGYDPCTAIIDLVLAEAATIHPIQRADEVAACQIQYGCRLWSLASSLDHPYCQILHGRIRSRKLWLPMRMSSPSSDLTTAWQIVRQQAERGLIRLPPESTISAMPAVAHLLHHPPATPEEMSLLQGLHLLWRITAGRPALSAGPPTVTAGTGPTIPSSASGTEPPSPSPLVLMPPVTKRRNYRQLRRKNRQTSKYSADGVNIPADRM